MLVYFRLKLFQFGCKETFELGCLLLFLFRTFILEFFVLSVKAVFLLTNYFRVTVKNIFLTLSLPSSFDHGIYELIK